MSLDPRTWNTATPADQRRWPPEAVFAAGLRHHHIANTAYPIHHTTTMRPYRVPRDQAEQVALAAWDAADTLGLYVHVPFCQVRCKYCEYAVVDRNEQPLEEAYFSALEREFALYRELLGTRRKKVIGFDIGGGTPAWAQTKHIRQVVETARESFSFQPGMVISIETTPVIADREPEKIAAFQQMGIGRISMGVQTTHLRLARSMGREYDGPTMLERAVGNIRQAGFDRFNIDLMYGFANQTLASWRHTVEQTIALGPEYITLYRMRYKGTAIQEQAASVTLPQVKALETTAHRLLLAAGYEGWPGKNTYSRVPDDLGTSDYLTERVVKGTPYLGLGLAAQSFSPTTLSYNRGAASKSLRSYLSAIAADRLPLQDLYHLPLEVAMAKMIAVSFYFGGVHQEHFRAKFGVNLAEQFPDEIAFLLDRGLMAPSGPWLRLTPEGVDHFNGVIALFYSGAVKAYLVGLEEPFSVSSSQLSVARSPLAVASSPFSSQQTAQRTRVGN
jgi:oxygen-independent coproporphyrinogen-3 oxidase